MDGQPVTNETRRSTRAEVAMGVGFAGALPFAVLVVTAVLIGKDRAIELLALALFGIAAVYFGFATRDARWREGIIQVVAMAAFFALTFLGLWADPIYLAVGYFGHGIWDLIHHRRIQLVKTSVPDWYVYGCIFFDSAAGLFVLLWWSM